MTTPTYDVVAIGNAIVDILAQTDDAFLAGEGMTKGAMQLIFSPEEADALYARMGPGREISGGSAANTLAGIAALGGRTAFIGQVADDQLGEVFAHDIREMIDLYDLGDGRQTQRAVAIQRCRDRIDALEQQKHDIDAAITELTEFVGVLGGGTAMKE